MRRAAYIVAIIWAVLLCFSFFGLISLAWTIPMTIAIKKTINDNKKHVALGVCTLIFFSLPAGIILLISNGEVVTTNKTNNTASQNNPVEIPEAPKNEESTETTKATESTETTEKQE